MSTPTTENEKSPSTQNKPKKPKAVKAKTSLKTGPFLELFQKENCPFSHRVRKTLSELGLDFIAHNVTPGNDLQHKALVDAGGKDQIPFLVDHRTGVHLYESGAIEAYLENEYGPETPQGLSSRIQKLSDRIRGRADQIAWSFKGPQERVEKLRENAAGLIATVQGTLRLIRSTVKNRSETPSSAKAAPTESPANRKAA